MTASLRPLPDRERGQIELAAGAGEPLAIGPLAIDRLALAYRKGEFGLAPDERKALEYEARSRALRGLADGGRKATPARRPVMPKVPGA